MTQFPRDIPARFPHFASVELLSAVWARKRRSAPRRALSGCIVRADGPSAWPGPSKGRPLPPRLSGERAAFADIPSFRHGIAMRS
jgi:hypothetical protein